MSAVCVIALHCVYSDWTRFAMSNPTTQYLRFKAYNFWRISDLNVSSIVRLEAPHWAGGMSVCISISLSLSLRGCVWWVVDCIT